MWEFFKDGGFVMWPILVFGVLTIAAAIRFAVKPGREKIGFIVAIGLTTLIAVLHGTVTDFGAVFGALANPTRVPDAQLTRTMWDGFQEATRPGAFGGALLTLAAIAFSAGVLRLGGPEAKP